MTTSLQSIDYPSGDGSPLAESFAHLNAILTTFEVLRQFLEGQKATVLANQYMYYEQGNPRLRVAPDVMVACGVRPGGRDNYVISQEGIVPSVIFEVTSPSTQNEDKGYKKKLYARLGVVEYWLFDPKGEWIMNKLKGNRLITFEEEGKLVNHYVPITDGISQPLGLRLVVEGSLIGFHRIDNGQKLLSPSELAAEVRRTSSLLERERQRADQADQRAAVLLEQLRTLGLESDAL